MDIKLIQFQSAFGLPSPSPFCMKAEILLKMAGQDYQTEDLADPSKSPLGKLPYIADDGTDVADSALIQRHLEEKYDIDFDAGLNKEQRAVSHAMARMAEERLYWVIVYSRWMEPSNWAKISKLFFSSLPPIVRNIVPIIANRQVKAALNGHGLGRHKKEDIYGFGAEDLSALAAQLDEKQFMFGDKPTSLDAIAYSTIASALIEELPSPLLTAAKSHSNFAAYVERCRKLWFPGFTG